jgi:fumarate hydratase class II
MAWYLAAEHLGTFAGLIVSNVTHSITIMTDSCTNFRKFLVEGTKPNLKKINHNAGHRAFPGDRL